MPVGAFVPSRIHLDYPEWQAPLIGNVGQVWAYDGTGYVPTSFLLSSAVSVYGLTLASAADAAAARTALALGTAAVLNVGTGANQIVQLDGSARLPAVDGSQLTGISGGSVAGSNTQVIINDGGAFGADAGLTYAKAADALTVAGYVVTPAIRPAVDGTSAFQVRTAGGTSVMTVDTTSGEVSLTGTSGALTNNAGGLSQYYTAGLVRQTLFSSNGWYRFGSGWQVIDSALPGWRFDAASHTTAGSDIFSVYHRAAGAGAAAWTQYWQISATGLMAVGSHAPTAIADLAAGTTNRASLRIRSGTAPTTPAAGDIWDDGALVAYNIDATTNTVVNSLKLRRGSSGTPAAGFGLGVAARLESSTTEDQDAGRLTWEWATVTHASRASRGKLSAYYTTTEQAAMTWDGDAGGLKLAFYPGVTPVARQLLATGAGATVDDVIQALQNLGLLKQS